MIHIMPLILLHNCYNDILGQAFDLSLFATQKEKSAEKR